MARPGAPGYTGSIMAKRLLILGNSVHPLLFQPSLPWRTLLRHVDTDTINVPLARQSPILGHYSHVLLSGSEASILQPKPWFETEAAWIRELADRGTPILGSCFGLQMLVYALSGPQWIARAPSPEIGWSDVRMVASDPLFANLPNPWASFVFHLDQVVSPPEPWRVLGRTDACPAHVLRYGEQPIWGIQAHPEISARRARRFLRATALLGLKSPSVVRRATRATPPPNDAASTILRNFLSLT